MWSGNDANDFVVSRAETKKASNKIKYCLPWYLIFPGV